MNIPQNHPQGMPSVQLRQVEKRKFARKMSNFVEKGHKTNLSTDLVDKFVNIVYIVNKIIRPLVDYVHNFVHN